MFGVVEEGRGRVTTSSKVSKIAGMFQGGGGGRGPPEDDPPTATTTATTTTTTTTTAGGGGDGGPSHATVVRTESHLARFNNARALFEKMGQGEAPQPKVAVASKVVPAAVFTKGEVKGEVKVVSKFETKLESSSVEGKRSSSTTTTRPGVTPHHIRRATLGDTTACEERGLGRSPRGESISPARSLGGEASSSSSRSPSPSPSRTTNGHAHHSEQEGAGGNTGVSLGVVGLRRPGSSSSRSLSTSSTESDPPARRWPPGKLTDSRVSSRTETMASDLRRTKPEKPAKPESLERKMSSHEQHQELIARHKNWFQAFSKNRSPASSPIKGEPRPGSPSKCEVTPLLMTKSEEGRPTSPSKPEWKSSYVYKADLKSPRGMSSSEEQEGCEGRVREKEERWKEKEESEEDSITPRTVSEQEAWSSVLQSRYGPRAKDILSPRTRTEGETSTDWRKERAAILSGRAGRRNSGGSEEGPTPPVKSQARFEDAATLQSNWSPPQHYSQLEAPTAPRVDQSEAPTSARESQSAAVKTLKEEINVAQSERAKNVRSQGVRENGSAHDAREDVRKREMVALERKEEADLIVSESVVLKDVGKEKDIIDPTPEPVTKPDLSDLYSVVGRAEDRPKKHAQSKETSEEVNAKLKESSSCFVSLGPRETCQLRDPSKEEEEEEEEEEGERKREEGERKWEEGERKWEEGERKREEGERKREEGERKREEGERKREEGERKREEGERKREELLEVRRRREKGESPQRGVRARYTDARPREGGSEDSRDARPHREDSRDARPHREDSRDARPHREDSRDARPHREDSRDARPHREDSRDARPHREDSRDARPHREDSRDARPHREDSRDARPHREESRDARPHREDSRDARPHREDSRDARPHREDSRDARPHREDSRDHRVSSGSPWRDSNEEVGHRAGNEELRERSKSRDKPLRKARETRVKERKRETGCGRGELAQESGRTTPPPPQTTPTTEEEEEACGARGADVVVGGVLNALRAETVYVSSCEDVSLLEDYHLKLVEEEGGQVKEDLERRQDEVEEEVEVKDDRDPEKDDHELGDRTQTRRQLFPDVVAQCEARAPGGKGDDGAPRVDEAQVEEQEPPGVMTHDPDLSQGEVKDVVPPGDLEPPGDKVEGPEKVPSPPLSPRAQSLAALDALIHGRPPQGAETTSPGGHVATEEEIMYDHTVISAQHKIQFCTAPVTVEGLAPDLESHDTDPEPLPPPIPPHGVDPSSITEVQPSPTSQPEDPEVMTADEAQRLLSAKESQSLLSDEEAQEVVLLLSPQEQDASKVAPPVPQHFSDTPPAVPPHYTEAAPPIPPHYTPGEDEYDTRVASHFDPSLTSPLSPEDEPSEADSSEASGDVYQVSRVKEVLVEDGVHYLEDGHFWVEVPGLPEEDEDDDNDPSMPYHPHTKLTFSKDPVQVFSTYSVTEYDRKNDEVDPVAASAEYELEKRVEKMDLFPVEIVKGEGGLGLSIIGMGVGADAGVEKLGIFVKTITQGGATERDGRIQVNDQIIEVDGKSLVGVTQVFAASVLKNTSGRVHFLIGREKDPENSEVALLIKQSLQADREREERRRALGGPDYDPHTGQSLFDPLSSPSEENSRSEDVSVQHNYSSYLEGGSSPTSPDATSPPPEVFDLEGDTSDTSPDNDVAVLKLKLKEVQYRNAVAEAEITKLKMSLLEMEKVVTENTKYTSQLLEAQNKMADLDTQLQSKLSEVSTYQDMLEQSQGQFIVLEKKYYKAKKIIKEYQGRERDFLHREEYHITQLEEKDSHYNALVKALKDRVIHLEAELTSAQKKAGLPIQVPSDTSTQPAYWNLQQNTQSALAKQPPRKPSLCTLDPEISDTETSDTGTSEGEKANTVERKIPVKEELDEAVPPHELLDVSASRAKGELASRGGLANRHLPSLKKTTSMSSASSQEQSLDDSSLDDDLPEAVKHPPVEAAQDGQQDQGSRRSAETQESPLPPHSPSHTTSSITYAKSPQPPSYTQATMGNVSHLGSPPPYLHPPGQFGSPRQPFTSSHVSSDPSSGLPTRPLGAGIDSQSHESRSESRPEIPYRHPPPVARVQPVNRAEISESTTLASHLANRTPQQQSLAEQLKALLAERELESDATQQRNDREASPSKRSPTSLMEDVRQAVMQADVTSSVHTQQHWQHLGKKPVISAPVHLSSTAHVVSGQLVHQVSPPQRSQSSFYSTGGRESVRDSNAGSQSPRIGRGSLHASPGSGVSASPSGVVLLSQRPLDSSLPAHKLAPGVDGSSGDLSSGPASLGSGDEGSGASLGSQSSLSHTHPPTERTKRSHMWQTAPVVDWTKEQVSQWLVVQGLESCVGRFQDVGMTGPRLLNLDVRDLKALGLPTEEKTKLKRKVKELRIAVEKERKQAEKEKKEREKLQKKAEKLAEKAEKKKK
ncbi:uncharacterized protein Spn isoform X4 [Panulirus ornatus]|uniref:uncharacterized protein Spn isoform X4 n=1 Tax=Panulirus ornatus TaxID=150431 RepID=UPI003A8C4AA6